MGEVSLEAYSRLVGLIYESGTDEARWQAVLSELSDLFGGVSFVLKGHDLGANLNIALISASYDPSFVQSYAEFYSGVNPWVNVLTQMRVGVAGQPEVKLAHADLMKTEFFNDWLRPQGIDTAAGIVFHRDPQSMFSLSGDFGLKQADRVQSTMLKMLDLLSPHMNRSFGLARRIAGLQQRETFLVDHGRTQVGVFLVARSGLIVQANVAGETMTEQHTVVATDAGGRLRFLDPLAQARMQQALHVAASGLGLVPGEFSARGRDGPWLVSVERYLRTSSLQWLSPHFADREPIGLIHLRPPDPVAAFAARAGLTAAETAIARGLYLGQSLEDVASAKRIAVSTARNQLKSVFEKTGSHRQAELVALIRRGVAGQE